MADVNAKLKDYLSKSSVRSTSITVPNNGTASSNAGSQSYFQNMFKAKDASKPDSQLLDNDTTNGWFTAAQNDPLLPSLSKKQRVLGFMVCLLLGTFCLSLASLYVPFLILKARKFALLYTMGSLFIIFSFSLLWGPVNHIKHLLNTERLPFTTIYFGSMFATLYFSIWMHSTFLTVTFAVLQVLALVWYVISYIPGGQTGLRFFSKLFYSVASTTVQKTLPV